MPRPPRRPPATSMNRPLPAEKPSTTQERSGPRPPFRIKQMKYSSRCATCRDQIPVGFPAVVQTVKPWTFLCWTCIEKNREMRAR